MPRDSAGGHHRAVGLGQILARLRHHLCRGPAPLCREPLGLCAPVPRADAEARRRSRSRACRRRSRSSRRPPRAIRARPSAPSPRSTTICACSSRASAFPIRRRPACRSKARPCRRWSTASWRCRKARGSMLLAPIVRGRKGEYRKELADLQKRGFQRVKIDGKMHEIDAAPALDKKLKHDIEVVVDRIVVRDGLGNAARRIRSRRRSSSPTASPSPRTPTAASSIIFSAKFACPVSGFTIPEIEPRLFSFNNPLRRLPGLRRARHQAVLRSRAGGAGRAADRCARARSRPGPIRPRNITRRRSTAWRAHYKVSMNTPWKRSARRACATPSSSARAATPVTMRYDDGVKRLHDDAAVRGRDPQHGAALARDRQRLGQGGAGPLPERARRARPATASGSSPRRWRSRSTSTTSAR